MLPESFPWIEPLQAAALAARHETYWALLYSGQRPAHTGRFSYLCLYPQETVSGNAFAALSQKLNNDRALFDNAWFGYFSYEMLHDTERFVPSPPSFIPLQPLQFTRYGIILQFDHDSRVVISYREPYLQIPEWLQNAPPPFPALPEARGFSSPMSREHYLRAVHDTKEAILRGDFYQANITRKFTGEFAQAPDAFALFTKLCAASPASYSAFMRMGDAYILSSSPERFLTVDADGHMETRPIKGTAPRLADATADAKQKDRLQHSEKDRAENLMIVDLMRNDLSRSCEAGSIKVDDLFEVTSYATLHHMASTVSGQKLKDVTTLDVLQRCFPPGSMTGAPKISAIRWCMQKEQMQRGVYSGALGWFGGDGSCDFSVVIRTLVLRGQLFEFQVGGGIVADSNPESEWHETITKARGIMAALGVDIKLLEGI